MAETMRFELMDVAKHRRFSKPLQSTTLPRLRVNKPRKRMVRPTGFEPATHGLEIRCSSVELWTYNGRGGWIRTSDAGVKVPWLDRLPTPLYWWTHLDLNQGQAAYEAVALTN